MTQIDAIKQLNKASFSRLKKTGKKSDTSFDAAVEENQEEHKIQNTSAIQSINPLLSLQEVKSQRTAIEHGDKMLDLLDKYRVSLASGYMDNQALKELLNYLNEQRNSFEDLEIREIILEIEQRAKIELAKRGLI